MTNPNRLTDEEREAQEKAYEASSASLKDYDPSKVADGDKIVEDNNGASMKASELEKADQQAQQEAAEGGGSPDEGRSSAAERKAGKRDDAAK